MRLALAMVCKDIFMFVDETGNDDKQSNILAVACITTTHPDYLKKQIDILKKNILGDPYLQAVPSIKTSFLKKGFHYCEDHDEVRRKFLELIQQLPFKGYICYQHKENDFDPSAGYDWYDSMFGRLMFERLRANHDANIRICFEQQGSQVGHRLKEIQSIINRLVEEIQLVDEVEFPVSPKIISGSKNEVRLAIADYVAAIFREHVAFGIGQPASWQARNFDKIRPKIRLIQHYRTDEFFTSKHPFP